MSELVADLIQEVRDDTLNNDYSSTYGVQDSTILRQLNRAKDRIFSRISAIGDNSLFKTIRDIDLVGNQQAYSVGSDVYLSSKISQVFFLKDGLASEKRQLQFVPFRELEGRVSSFPQSYSRMGTTIYLSPIPSYNSGTLQVHFTRSPYRFDLRRGQITASTVVSSVLSVLTLDTSTDDENALSAATYLNVCDSDGTVLAENVQISNYNTSGGNVTLEGGSHTLSEGETVPVGAYVTVGQRASTHTMFPPEFDRYFAAYAIARMSDREASNQRGDRVNDFVALENDIIAAFRRANEDFQTVLIGDPEFRFW